MSSTLIIIGKSLEINKPFLNYIKSQISLHVDKILFLKKSDKNIFENLEKIITTSKKTLIIASKENFNLIGKVLSTLNEDSLELKEETLIPSKSINFSKDTYLLKYKENLVNVLLAKENELLPEIFLKDENKSEKFSLIGLDEDTAKILLTPLAETYEIKLESTSIVEGWSLIEASTYKYGNIDSFLKSAKSLFPDKFISTNNTLAHIVTSLAKANKTISVAESCTGGQIATMITSISGSSKVFNGSVVSYANHIKRGWLGVSEDTLKTYGAVSELCVREMLEGILKLSNSDFALATSGIAGPSGGSKEKPIGTVFVGARNKKGDVIIERVLLKGDRNYIQTQSSYHAFRLLFYIGKEIFFKN
jgi:nicotinamide-nucleotide amidase